MCTFIWHINGAIDSVAILAQGIGSRGCARQPMPGGTSLEPPFGSGLVRLRPLYFLSLPPPLPCYSCDLPAAADTLLALPWCPPRSFYSTWPSRSSWFSSWRPWHATQAGRYKVLGFGTLPGPPALPGCRHGGPGTQRRLVEGKSLTKCRLSEGTLFRWDTQSAGFRGKRGKALH